MSPITGGPAGEWPTQSRVLDADPDTPTADAPADTGLRERIEWLIGNAPARLLVDALLLVFAEHERAQVEAARRDGWDEGWDEGHQWTMFKRGLERETNPYRAARGETRQPCPIGVHADTRDCTLECDEAMQP